MNHREKKYSVYKRSISVNMYVLAKKSWPILYSMLQYEKGQDFLDIQCSWFESEAVFWSIWQAVDRFLFNAVHCQSFGSVSGYFDYFEYEFEGQIRVFGGSYSDPWFSSRWTYPVILNLDPQPCSWLHSTHVFDLKSCSNICPATRKSRCGGADAITVLDIYWSLKTCCASVKKTAFKKIKFTTAGDQITHFTPHMRTYLWITI